MTTATTSIAQVQARDLEAIIDAYNEVTERLKRSHEMLRSEVVRLREQLDEKNKELARRERLAALGEMAAGVAHEIRNPLAGIGLYAGLLERDLCDQPDALGIASKIGAGVRKLDGIVSDILAFARGAEPVLCDVTLGEILERVLTQTAPQADARQTMIEVDPGLAEAVLACDERQIERALLNLVFNAMDAAGDGGRVWIRRGTPPEDSGLFSIVVEDDGCGIDPNLLQRVFNPFFTTKDNGTGLGLAIVHRIAEAHGGLVSAENLAAGGASLTLCVPVARGARQRSEDGGNG